MTLHKPVWMQPASGDPDSTYTGAETRALLAALSPFQGVFNLIGGAYSVTQRGAGANLSVDVAAGYATIIGDDIAGQNNYLCWSDATANLVMPAAPGSGTRFHRVGLRLRDKQASGSWTTYEFLPDVVQDTGSGLPAEPASFLTLAQASIAAGQSSYTNAQITDMRYGAEPQRRYKPANTGPRTSSTLVNDPDLSVMLAPNAVYQIILYVVFVGPVLSSGIDMGWSTPSGITGEWGAMTSQGGGTGTAPWGGAWSTTVHSSNPAGADWSQLFAGTAITGSSGGPLTFKWNSGDNTSNMTVKLGSWLRAERIA